MEALRESLAASGQEHLLAFWNDLSPSDQEAFVADLSSIDFSEALSHFEHACANMKEMQTKKDDRLKPFPEEQMASVARSSPKELANWRETGLKEIGAGHVAVLLLAGGQGTRLGVDYPKGMYDVGLPSAKTLYQLQAERILKLEQLAGNRGGKVPWYIMTSEHTQGKTIEFFEKHGYFGLDPKNVVFFEQAMLPCMDFNGKVILAEKGKVARAPNGNGGLYKALKTHKILEDMKIRGVTCMHVYCVDNILVKMADPVFVGYCIERKADCGAKVVQKAFPTEAVGVVCICDDKFQVVEYSEITLETAQKRSLDGRLVFHAGNICNHFFTVDFVMSVVEKHEKDLQHHVAKKKIPHVDEKGTVVKPTQPNGMKIEKFVFDVFEFAKNFQLLEVLREDEFSPLKNGPGSEKDTPESARQSLMNLHYRYMLAAGGSFRDESGQTLPLIPLRRSNSQSSFLIECEISPLVSYSGEGLEDLVKDKYFKSPCHLNGSMEEKENGESKPKRKRLSSK